ncbi:hypothetical protein MPTK1_1g11430 [Marchantia polymorpha subsp. ruderalis]|nr:hypothetical protein MARPO_0014s0083 [Marchantia polymorpha]BBM98175.1 hypothetical protein Mp_1g11430 [Marchantia polymorpha subsp. ruderalis]|eukprot:PTQ45548.1 hypothetical protein MARPO_0014s0083 [Marchantia polymorpha]
MDVNYSKAEAELVKASWEMFKKDSIGNALIFFKKIFEVAPDMRDLFPFTQDYTLPLEKNYKLKAHALLVFKLTGDAAVQLGEHGSIESLHPKLIDLGKKHLGYGVLLEHFVVVRTALLHTIEGAVPADWTAEQKNATTHAWSRAYDELVAVMQAEMDATRKAAEAAWRSDY